MKAWMAGHSPHGFDVFVALLAAHGIALPADIRTVARSGHHPHFHADTLARSLPDRVAYLHPAPPGRLAARGSGLAERCLAE